MHAHFSETIGKYPGGVQSSSMQRGYGRAFFSVIMAITVICFFLSDHITDLQLNMAGININTAKSGFLLFFKCLKLFSKKSIKAKRRAKVIAN